MRTSIWIALALLAPAAALGAEPPASGANDPLPETTPPSTAKLDFDLLGPPATPPPAFDDDAAREKHTMLKVHQGLGIGLLTLQVATTAIGTLNYLDRYGANGGRTARWGRPHAALAYATFTVFVTNGTIALLAPEPKNQPEGFGRVGWHKAALLTASAGMLTEVVLGIVTANRVGLDSQASLARTHLVIGYGTLAAMLFGVGALVF